MTTAVTELKFKFYVSVKKNKTELKTCQHRYKQ